MKTWIQPSQDDLDYITDELYPIESGEDPIYNFSDCSIIDFASPLCLFQPTSDPSQLCLGLADRLKLIWMRSKRPHPITSDEFLHFLLRGRLQWEGEPEDLVADAFRVAKQLPDSQDPQAIGYLFQSISIITDPIPIPIKNELFQVTGGSREDIMQINLNPYDTPSGIHIFESNLFALYCAAVINRQFHFVIIPKRITHNAVHAQLSWFKAVIGRLAHLACDTIDTEEYAEPLDIIHLLRQLLGIYFSEHKRSSVGGRIKRSIQVFETPHWLRTPTDIFLSTVRAMEQLLGERDSLSESTARRLSALCVEHSSDRPTFKKMIKKSYGLRSRIVHGDTHEITGSSKRRDLQFLRIAYAKSVLAMLEMILCQSDEEPKNPVRWDEARDIIDTSFESGSVVPKVTYSTSPMLPKQPGRKGTWRVCALPSSLDEWFAE